MTPPHTHSFSIHSFQPPSNHSSPSVSSRFHSVPVQRISVKQAQSSPPASAVLLFSCGLILRCRSWPARRHPPPRPRPPPSPSPSFYLADADLLVNLCKTINKKIKFQVPLRTFSLSHTLFSTPLRPPPLLLHSRHSLRS